jgi:hypothetical protein
MCTPATERHAGSEAAASRSASVSASPARDMKLTGTGFPHIGRPRRVWRQGAVQLERCVARCGTCAATYTRNRVLRDIIAGIASALAPALPGASVGRLSRLLA